MKILSITIIRDKENEFLYLNTDLPQPLWPFEKSGAQFRMSMALGFGKKYVEEHFPNVPVKIINAQ